MFLEPPGMDSCGHPAGGSHGLPAPLLLSAQGCPLATTCQLTEVPPHLCFAGLHPGVAEGAALELKIIR